MAGKFVISSKVGFYYWWLLDLYWQKKGEICIPKRYWYKATSYCLVLHECWGRICATTHCLVLINFDLLGFPEAHHKWKWLDGRWSLSYFSANVYQWFAKTKYIPKSVLLFPYGHTSHATLKAACFCHNHGIISMSTTSHMLMWYSNVTSTYWAHWSQPRKNRCIQMYMAFELSCEVTALTFQVCSRKPGNMWQDPALKKS